MSRLQTKEVSLRQKGLNSEGPTKKTNELRFVSWNTCGVRDTTDFPNKFQDITRELEELETDIVFLQETHIGPKHIDIFRHHNDMKGWHSFFTVHHARSKGVAILIRKTVKWEYQYHDEDFGGSYIVLGCQLQGKEFTLVNVYNHAKDKSVLQRLTQYLQENAKGIIVVGGDFNTILHYDFDRKLPTGHLEPLRPFLEEFISSLCLVDVWGRLNPKKRQFTCSIQNRTIQKTSSKKQKTNEIPPKKCHMKRKRHSFSRLDMFFIPWDAMHYVKNCRISKSKISDHEPIILDVSLKSSKGHERFTGNPVEYHPISLGEAQGIDKCKNPGEISGAEVQMAIKSLRVWDKLGTNQEKDHGRNWVTVTNSLKFKFNNMISCRKPIQIEQRSIEYLILTTILARRLAVYLRPSFKSRTHQKKCACQLPVTVTLRKVPKTTNWSFLEMALKSKTLKQIHPAPPRNFRILETLLRTDGQMDSISLRPQYSPLTSAILTLSLKWLADKLRFKLKECEVDVCWHRQCMAVYINKPMYGKLIRELSELSELSNMDLVANVDQPAVDLGMETANRRLSQGQGGASSASSSSTMQEFEAEDSGGDTEDLRMETANRRLSQGEGGASSASSSSTMQEFEAEDSGGDTEDLGMETANRRLSQGRGGASSASSSSTMQESEAEDNGGDTEEDSEDDWIYFGDVKKFHWQIRP